MMSPASDIHVHGLNGAIRTVVTEDGGRIPPPTRSLLPVPLYT